MLENDASVRDESVLDIYAAMSLLDERLQELNPSYKAETARAVQELCGPDRPPAIPIDIAALEADLRRNIIASCRKDNIEKMTHQEAWSAYTALTQMEQRGECWSSLLPHGTRAHELWRAAERAAKNAYAPYSNFYVGAAILTADGNIHAGCNVEAVDYDGTHAEESALSAMVVAGDRCPTLIAIVAMKKGHGDAVAVIPCGKCRQKLIEFTYSGQLDIDVISEPVAVAIGRDYKTVKLSRLLPDAFGFRRRR